MAKAKEKITYVLSAYGEVKAVIVATSQEELMKKTALAIQEEECAEEKTTTVKFPDHMGDWGEETGIVAIYVDNGEQVTNTDYSLMKCVSY